MHKEPWFWTDTGFTASMVARTLSPLGALYSLGAYIKTKVVKPMPLDHCTIICIGNATLGGVGKTPFAIMLAHLLRDNGIQPAFLSRGYGGKLNGPVLVDPTRHSANDVGDESLLLSRHGAVIVAKDRARGARFAAEQSVNCLIADDGYQNPALHKDVSILLIGKTPNNQHIFPAGPYREPLVRAISRADAVVYVGSNPELPAQSRSLKKNIMTAQIHPHWDKPTQPYVAFCGIGTPQRFFDSLDMVGIKPIDKIAFPDHHPFDERQMDMLFTHAKKHNATLITTEKDFMRISSSLRDQIEVLPITMSLDDPSLILDLCMRAISSRTQRAGK